MKDQLHPITKEFVKKILQHPLEHEWTLQGFGMLRWHLSDEYRLNIWDDRFRVPNVSMIHTHPWNFDSLVVAGRLDNIRLREKLKSDDNLSIEANLRSGGNLHKRGKIVPGVNNVGLEFDSEEEVWLFHSKTEKLSEGCVYHQEAEEIHASYPVNGSVTLNHRVRVGEDIAFVYWNTDKWISAKPRVATIEEIVVITKYSLEKWF